MVIYFESNVVSPPVVLFMGADKYENEKLLQWGWPEDVWFHVDKVSSAHVYLRLHPGQTIDDIPSVILEDAGQLVKFNSIEGSKIKEVDVVYTMWENVKKTSEMEIGQVGFHSEKEVRKMKIVRDKTIINRLVKTKKVVENPDLRSEREIRDVKIKEAEKHTQRKILMEQKEMEKQEKKRKQEEAELRSYSTLLKPEKMTSNEIGITDDDFW